MPGKSRGKHRQPDLTAMPQAPHTEDARFQTLLERWAAGDVTAAEERELLHLAKDDVFRKEALEGFLQFPEADHAAHLSSLRVRINASAPGQGMPRWRVYAWSAAAAAVLIACSIWWLRPTSAEQNASDNAPIAAVEEKKADPLTAPKSQTPETISRTKPTPAKPLPPAGQPASGGRGEDAAKKDALEEVAIASESKQEKMADALPPARSAPVNPAPAGAKPTPPSPPSQIRILPNDIWWQDLQRYLRTNARLTPLARNNNVSGTVRLRGHLIPEGRLVDIEFAETLGYGLEVEALRLMQDYNWPVNKDSVLEVEIKFVR
ncbi:MAG: hypothetical protein ACOYNO_11180 [Saprospiraceae bacterium]